MLAYLVVSAVLQVKPDQRPFCKIVTSQGQLTSGCVIETLGDGDVLILTCRHGHDGKVSVYTHRGTANPREAKVVWEDSKSDLALIRMTPEVATGSYSLGDSSPAIGATVRFAGFGHRSFADRKTVIKGEIGGLPQTEAASRHGDSGAPVIYQGRIVGIMVRTLGRRGVNPRREGGESDGLFVPAETIKEFVQSYKSKRR